MTKLVIEVQCNSGETCETEGIVSALIRYISKSLSHGTIEAPIYDSHGTKVGNAKLDHRGRPAHGGIRRL